MGLNYVLMFPGAGSNAGGLGQVSEFALKMMNSAIKMMNFELKTY